MLFKLRQSGLFTKLRNQSSLCLIQCDPGGCNISWCLTECIYKGDYLTGMAASKVEALDQPGDPAYGWNSKKGMKGILKKVGYLCVIAVAMVVDYVILIVAKEAELPVKAKVLFGLLVTVWYIFNELLSIIENAGRMGSPVPAWLAKYIAVLRTGVEHRLNQEEKL